MPLPSETTALLGALAALAVGVVSPGPSFVMVARTAAAQSRAHGLAAAVGMGAGGLLFAVAALLGLHGLLQAAPTVFGALKIAGGLYLAWLGLRIWRGARQPLPLADVPAAPGAADDRRASSVRALGLGFATQVSNPKTAIVYASLFAAFLPAQFDAAFAVALVVGVFVVEAGWYALVALALSAAAPRGAYLRWKHWIDRAAGAVMIGLGARLALAARP